MSRYLMKMIDWVLYKGTVKPTDGISDARWRAMINHIMREYLSG